MHDPRIWLRAPPEPPPPWDTVVTSAVRTDEQVLAQVSSVARTGVRMVRVSGGDRQAWLDRLPLIAGTGISTAVVVPATHISKLASEHPARLTALYAAGLRRICVVVTHSNAADHDRLIGLAGDYNRLMSLLASDMPAGLQRRLLIVALPGVTDVFSDLVTLAVRWGWEPELAELPNSPHPQGAVAVASALRAAESHGIELHVRGFRRPPPPPGDPTRGLIRPEEFRLRASDVPLPALAHGATVGHGAQARASIAAAGGLVQLARHLSAVGCPVRDLPACLGGDNTPAPQEPYYAPACKPCPHRPHCDGVEASLAADPEPPWDWSSLAAGTRILVAIPFITDRVTTLSTLPSLARALTRAGANVRVQSVWHRPWNMHEPAGPRSAHTDYSYVSDRIETSKRFSQTFLERLDPDDAEIIVVPGLDNAAKVLVNPRRMPGTRVLAIDFHMLEHVQDLHSRWVPSGASPVSTPWWPSDDLRLLSCFPGYAWTYRSHGIPLRHVSWRKYPLCTKDFTPGPPASTCSQVLGTGNQFRDWQTLRDAVAQLDMDEVVVYTGEDLEDWGRLVCKGQTSLLKLYAEMQRARFIVVPLRWDPDRAAGITNFQLALAAGRPVIATRVPAAVDHLEDGVNSLLVEVGDVDGLAKAIQSMGDDRLVDRLAKGALKTAQENGTDRWAQQLMHGRYPAV